MEVQMCYQSLTSCCENKAWCEPSNASLLFFGLAKSSINLPGADLLHYDPLTTGHQSQVLHGCLLCGLRAPSVVAEPQLLRVGW